MKKLELSTPRRENLSVYKEILYEEFEEKTCFYCGKKLKAKTHVDHFIPWSFVKDDKIWNFVLACPSCNEKKSNKLPSNDYLFSIKKRNRKLRTVDNFIVQTDFKSYSEDTLDTMWKYAKMSGFKEFKEEKT